MDQSAEHSELVNQALIAVSQQGVKATKTHSMMARTYDTYQPVRIGTPGWSDITAIVPPFGRALLLEAKTGNARQSTQQHKFEDIATQTGAVYGVIRSVDDIGPLVQKARELPLLMRLKDLIEQGQTQTALTLLNSYTT